MRRKHSTSCVAPAMPIRFSTQFQALERGVDAQALRQLHCALGTDTDVVEVQACERGIDAQALGQCSVRMRARCRCVGAAPTA